MTASGRHFKQLNWLSALDRGEEQSGPYFPGDAAIDRVVTNTMLKDKKSDSKSDTGPTKRFRNSDHQVTAETCRRAFHQAREHYPDALYFELTDIVAKQLQISGRQCRNLVPNPFR